MEARGQVQVTIHSPTYQKAGNVGRFIACTGCIFRSGYGSEQENREQFDAHLRTVAALDVPCPRVSPFPTLTEPQCVTGPAGHRGACVFPGTDGRTPLTVNAK